MQITDYLISNFSFMGIIGSAIVANVFPFIPEEIFLLGMGYIAWSSWYYFIYFVVFLIIGFMISDSFFYYLAYSDNKLIMKYARQFFGEWLLRDEGYVKRNIKKIIFFSRAISYMRFIGPFLAGYYKIPYKQYVKINIGILIIYVPILLTLGYVFGKQIEDLFKEGLTLSNVLQVVGLIVFIILVSKFMKRAFDFAFNPLNFRKLLHWAHEKSENLLDLFPKKQD